MPAGLADPCPWCGAKAIDITTMDHQGPAKFFCAGNPCHEWIDGEGPEPPVESENDIQPARPGFLQRLLGRRLPALS